MIRRVSPTRSRLRRPELLSPDRVSADDYDGSVPVSEWLDTATESNGQVSRWQGLLRRHVGLIATAATVAVVALLGTIYLSERWAAGSDEPPFVYQTKTGEHEHVTLPDGSSVILGGSTKILTQYSSKRRVVFLEEGEALFSVAKSRSRPFSVVAAGGSVTAIGTVFDVRSDLNRVTVTVKEGVVNVVPSDASNVMPAEGERVINVKSRTARNPSWTPTRLTKEETVTYTEADGIGAVGPAEPGATEWVSGRLQYRQVPLKYVAADVQRYLDKSLILVDAAAGEYEFTGTIDQTQITDWLSALGKIFPLDVIQSADRIVIQSRSNPALHSIPQ